MDIIIPEEYDPRICREKDIKYRVKVDDPLKLELLKKQVKSCFLTLTIAASTLTQPQP